MEYKLNIIIPPTLPKIHSARILSLLLISKFVNSKYSLQSSSNEIRINLGKITSSNKNIMVKQLNHPNKININK
jgi:hypothetical protein